MGIVNKAIKAFKEMKPPGFKDWTRNKKGKLEPPKSVAVTLREKQLAKMNKTRLRIRNKPKIRTGRGQVVAKPGYALPLGGVNQSLEERAFGRRAKTSMKKRTKRR